ncbi:MAG: SUMF1/EgtB/PvdO family nonheme iron enzyme, partial [Bacteroidales bacterium]|nr:SUMF1/EgtB/PvdO family nonheme iron enzyme [Bacteroidales bacterium]
NNPQGPEQGSYRVLRGGCWSGYEGFCRVSSRGYFSPDSRCDRNGFRLALSE